MTNIDSNSIREFLNDGYSIQRQLLTIEQVNTLNKIISESFVSDEIKTVIMPHTHRPEIIDVIKKSKIMNILEEILGNKFNLIQTQLFLKPPGTRGFSLHQDNFYNRPEDQDSLVSVWIALENANKDNGTLYLYPGSHKNGLAYHKKNWPYALKKILRFLWIRFLEIFNINKKNNLSLDRFATIPLPQSMNIATINANKGDVCFIHGNIFHGSFDNTTTDKHRRVLLCIFVKDGIQFKSGLFAKRKPVTLR